MALPDSKIVHAGMLRAKHLVVKLLALNADFQELKSDWVSEGGQAAYTRWVAAQGANLTEVRINGDTVDKLNTVTNNLDSLCSAIQVELDELKGGE